MMFAGQQIKIVCCPVDNSGHVIDRPLWLSYRTTYSHLLVSARGDRPDPGLGVGGRSFVADGHNTPQYPRLADWERAMRETKFILEATACLATLIMLALAVADWVLKFLT
jgi:hypothetical protein